MNTQTTRYEDGWWRCLDHQDSCEPWHGHRWLCELYREQFKCTKCNKIWRGGLFCNCYLSCEWNGVEKNNVRERRRKKWESEPLHRVCPEKKCRYKHLLVLENQEVQLVLCDTCESEKTATDGAENDSEK